MTHWTAAMTIAAGASWLGFLFGDRRERLKEERARNFVAVVELAAAIRQFQRLLRAYGREHVGKADVIKAFGDWAVTVDSSGHQLPAAWRHLPHSVRDATGTVFGAVSLIHIRPDVRQLDLCEPDAVWQDYADDYMDYAIACLNAWGRATARGRKILMSYDQWLRRTGRVSTVIGI